MGDFLNLTLDAAKCIFNRFFRKKEKHRLEFFFWMMESDSLNFKKQSSKQLAFGMAQVLKPWATDPKEPGSNTSKLLFSSSSQLK